jgi:hypothetical protein
LEPMKPNAAENAIKPGPARRGQCKELSEPWPIEP